ncbi:MAG: hypothetical protein AAF269_16255 [Pseudomonadota bacterium]
MGTHAVLPAQAGIYGGWLIVSTAMDPDLRQECGTLFDLIQYVRS